jgi:adenosylcobyric acid synthase
MLASDDGAATLPDGAIDHDGLTLGTYLHGLFDNSAVRRGILDEVALRAGKVLPAERDESGLDDALDRLADGVRHHLHIESVYRMIDMKVG